MSCSRADRHICESMVRVSGLQGYSDRAQPRLILFDERGALDGGAPMSHDEMAMLHVLVAYFTQCHISYLRIGHVTITFSPCCMSLSPMSHVEFKKCPSRFVDFRGQEPYQRDMTR